MIRSERVKASFRVAGDCDLCGQWCPRRECVHVYPAGMGGWARLDIPENCLGGCPSEDPNGCGHHTTHHNQRWKFPTSRLLAIKAEKLGWAPEDLKAFLDAKQAETRGISLRADQTRKPPTKRQAEQKARSLRAKAADYLRKAEALEAGR